MTGRVIRIKMLVDSHAHLYWDSFKDDLDKVVKRSIDAGITTIINIGVDIEKSKEALRQAQQLNVTYSEPSQTISFYSTIGIHPHEAVGYTQFKQTSHGRRTFDKKDKDIDELEQIYKSNPKKVIAVGECGLDFVFEGSEELEGLEGIEDAKQRQRKLFQAQIDLAKKLNLPLIVHCRDNRSKDPENSEAWREVLEMTKSHFGIYHCYSGLLNTTYKILNTNFLVSFAATITYPKNEYLREAAKILPLEKIVLETDCPFLPPQSKRGQRNEPAEILEITKLIAELRGVTFEEIARQTSKNVKMIFNL